jgi:hypothetical protein
MIKKMIIIGMFALSLVFALISFQGSSALDGGRLHRNTMAMVSQDSKGALGLIGFDGKTKQKINNNYKTLGNIVNNTNQTMIVTTTIQADFSEANTLLVSMGMYVGDQYRLFNRLLTQNQVTFQLKPGEELDLKAKLFLNNQKDVTLSFAFEASDLSGNYQMKLKDTKYTPRRMICY